MDQNKSTDCAKTNYKVQTNVNIKEETMWKRSSVKLTKNKKVESNPKQ